MNNDSFAMIDDIISLYSKGLLTMEECTNKAIQSINNATWFIWDPNVKMKAQRILYKRFFSKAHKAIISMEKS